MAAPPRPRWRRRLARALVLPASRRAWWEGGALWLAFAALATPLALWADLLPGRVALDGAWPFVRLLVLPLFAPAFVEELIFRGLLYPHPDEPWSRRRRGAWAAGSLVVYVALHPLNGRLLRPEALPVFTDPRFLLIVSLLGTAALVSYHRSGSLWPAVMMHYLTVTLWLSWGGLTLLGGG